MSNVREGIYSAIGTAAGVVIGGTVILAIHSGFSYVPQLETFFSPVVRFDPPVTVTYRDKLKSCFALNVQKLATAVPVKYEFFVEARLSARIVVSAYLATENTWDKASNSDLQTHAPRERWVRRYCFETPATIADFQAMRVTGYALHNRHPVYDTRTNIPPFTIPALAGS